MRLSVILSTVGFCFVGYLIATSLQGNDVRAPSPKVESAPATRSTWIAPRTEMVSARAMRRYDVPHSAKAPSPPVYGRNGRQINLGGLSVAQYLDTRTSAARMGDSKAGYEIYQALSICANGDELLGDIQEPRQRDSVLQERESLTKLCADISPAQIQERMQFLTVAAKAGNAAAQIDYYMEGPYGRPVDLAQSGADPIVQQWKLDALDYLKAATNQCDHFALGLLSTVYDAGELTERDMKLSMAYSIADAAARKVVVSDDRLRSRFADQMSSADFDAARQEGARLTHVNCGL